MVGRGDACMEAGQTIASRKRQAAGDSCRRRQRRTTPQSHPAAVRSPRAFQFLAPFSATRCRSRSSCRRRKGGSKGRGQARRRGPGGGGRRRRRATAAWRDSKLRRGGRPPRASAPHRWSSHPCRSASLSACCSRWRQLGGDGGERRLQAPCGSLAGTTGIHTNSGGSSTHPSRGSPALAS